MARHDFRPMSIDAARASFPIGTPVRYFLVRGCPSFVRTHVRSEPWALGCGEVVIKVAGRAGSVAVSHLARLV